MASRSSGELRSLEWVLSLPFLFIRWGFVTSVIDTTESSATPSQGGPSTESPVMTQNMTLISSATSSSSSSQTTPAPPKASRTRPVVGGILGGLVGLSVLCITIYFMHRHLKKRERHTTRVSFSLDSEDGVVPCPRTSEALPPMPVKPVGFRANHPMKVYVSAARSWYIIHSDAWCSQNPDDRSTFPSYFPPASLNPVRPPLLPIIPSRHSRKDSEVRLYPAMPVSHAMWFLKASWGHTERAKPGLCGTLWLVIYLWHLTAVDRR